MQVEPLSAAAIAGFLTLVVAQNKRQRGDVLRRILVALGVSACLLVLPAQAITAEAAPATYNHFPWGWCTWWAASVRPDIGAVVWGNASQWLLSAQRSGLKTGTVPKLGAIVVYQPGAQGAWWTGHVAQVLSVSPDGYHFTVDEMNWLGFGRVSKRVSHVGPGAGFIY